MKGDTVTPEELMGVSKTVKTDQEKMQDFVNEYNALCQKHGYQVAGTPIFVPTNHGTWEHGMQMSINKLEPPVR